LSKRRTQRLVVIGTGLVLAASVVVGPASATTPTTTPEDTTAASTAPDSTEAAGTTATEDTATGDTATDGTGATDDTSGGEGGGMRVTYTLSDVALWSDGTPISAADFECTWQATLNTPESNTTTGYDRISGVEQGATEKEVVVTFSEAYAGWKTLFATPALIKADEYEDCTDVSQDFPGAYTYGAGPYIMTDWTQEQAIYEKNPEYTGANTGGPERVVIVPAEDGVTPLKAGTVDFIYPQAYTGIDAELDDPNIEWAAEPGGQFEALYFMQNPDCTPDDTRSCAFADAAFREAFFKSIDMDAFYEQIYAPFAQGVPRLTCGPIAPGDFCNEEAFADTYDPEGAVAVLDEAGWTNEGGMWTNPDGEVPEVHWMVNTGNTRRESAQEFLIPLLAAQGFNVVADNCEATPCVFQTRLPAQQFDMGMYITTVAPDPSYLSATYTCDQIPSEENEFQGQNSTGWCNEAADAALKAADAELDPAARAELVKEAIGYMAEDFVLLPTLQFPNIGAYRTDQVEGTQNNLANYWAWNDWYNFEDLNGDGQVVIGAEQFPLPECANPITACANSSWFQWVAGFPNFPAMYWPTNDQQFVPSEFLAGEAVVEEL